MYESVVFCDNCAEINNAEITDEGFTMHFHIGSIPMHHISNGDTEQFVNYINEQIEAVKLRQEKALE
ncbi:hypothetical protein [Macrococcoides caseolyticum]|uniref:hypothetical protein n=1 Tax=Macrococcoides caseolyticum TaxID=69966 RepID=UPI001F237387|nr:hypothetical protein [Macrococcus caseolyticus]MCE4956513.1 hypothetical protein [Macrococcus caseolyticus]